ncbi:hypothetical protein [Microbacterium sp. KR10-403]|uniref:hypothetical protein n=1 Tax=Microbacterium sp. KR10-403 TaxID=3158581 RepID=UPI0032E3F068
MRTVVVGTSNSLVQGGLANGLSDGGLNIVANGSLPHSQTTILPFRLADSEIGGQPFDHLVVEITPDEQLALRGGLANFAMTRNVLDWMLCWCTNRGIRVTFVTMPELWSYKQADDLRAFAARQFVNTYAEDHRVQLFDGYVWLEAWAKGLGIEPTSCFATPTNMNVDISYEFGKHIAQSVDDHVALATAAAPGLEFEYIPLATMPSWADAHTRVRSAAADTVDLLQLERGAQFELLLKRGLLVGTVHNFAASTAALRIAGTESRTKRLDGNPRQRLMLTAWSLRTPVPVNGRTLLKALPVEYRPDLEPNHVTVWRPLNQKAKGVPVVELAGIVMAAYRSRRAARTMDSH